LSVPRWYLWEGGFLLTARAQGIVASHAHHAIQIVIALDGCVAICGKDAGWHESRGIVVRADAEHSFDCNGALGVMVFVDPESSEGTWLSASDASPRLYRSLRDEFAARSFQNLGSRPLVVVTATRDALAGWLPLQDRMAKLSTNSSHRLVPYTHDALVTDRTAAEASTQAIRDVLHAARSATPLK
jgi:hypothetical protein